MRKVGTQILVVVGLAAVVVMVVLCAFAQSPERGREGEPPRGAFMGWNGGAAMAASKEFVYVVRGNQLLQFRADTLELVKRVELETSRPSAESFAGRGVFQQGGKVDLAMMWSQGRAVGKGPVRLKTFPLRVEDIGGISPMGLMVGGHVTPSDHLGIMPKNSNVPPDHYDVLAPADGFIVMIQRVPKGNPDPAVRGRQYTGEYWMTIEHTGTFWTYVGLIEQLDKSIADQMGGAPSAGQPMHVRVPVKAGQVIGKMGGGHGLDFGVVNSEVTLKGFVNLEHFNRRDPYKPHAVDPFDYVDEPLKSKLLAVNVRKVKPFGGKIDYDVDGRLVGNWYRENSGGYAGFRGQLAYWTGHLSIVYHHIDPTKIVVSVGDFNGQPRQFWVKGNAPDPAKVSEASGLVKYELVWQRIGSAGQTFSIPDIDRVHGVLLSQLLDDRRLKVEVFPGRTAAEVSGFTNGATIYER